MVASTSGAIEIRALTDGDVPLMRDMLTMFGEAFDEVDTYSSYRPTDAYLNHLLGSRNFIAIAALRDGNVVGGIAAYELPKVERERREIYIYDLAVAAAHRREGIATALVRELQTIAAERGAYVIFVQADHGDEPAIALYTRLGKCKRVLHFDIPVRGKR